MRAVVMILLLALLLTAGVCGNYIYINEVTERLLARIDAFPAPDDPHCFDAVLAFLGEWERVANTVSLSVNYSVVDRVSEHAAALSSCAATQNTLDFYPTLELLRNAVRDVCRLERFSIGNLL